MGTWDLRTEAARWFDEAQEDYKYGPGAETLYDVCRRYPRHDAGAHAATISKLWLIGRSHSAALERRRAGGPDPYPPTADLMAAGGRLDALLDQMRALETYSPAHLAAVYTVVGHLAGLFQETTGQYKLSLASKYLHFHDPSVPIYDSISHEGLALLVPLDEAKRYAGRELAARGLGWYGKHLARFAAAHAILRQAGYDANARRIDTFLLYWNRP